MIYLYFYDIYLFYFKIYIYQKIRGEDQRRKEGGEWDKKKKELKSVIKCGYILIIKEVKFER